MLFLGNGREEAYRGRFGRAFACPRLWTLDLGATALSIRRLGSLAPTQCQGSSTSSGTTGRVARVLVSSAADASSPPNRLPRVTGRRAESIAARKPTCTETDRKERRVEYPT